VSDGYCGENLCGASEGVTILADEHMVPDQIGFNISSLAGITSLWKHLTTRQRYGSLLLDSFHSKVTTPAELTLDEDARSQWTIVVFHTCYNFIVFEWLMSYSSYGRCAFDVGKSTQIFTSFETITWVCLPYLGVYSCPKCSAGNKAS